MAIRRVSTAATAATVLAVTLGLAGCSDTTHGDTNTDTNGDGAGDAAGGLAAGADYTVLGALGELPQVASDGDPIVSTGDLVGASELAGMTRPEGDEELVQWIGALTGLPQDGEVSPVFVPLAALLHNGAGSPSEVADDLGWSLADVDAYAEVSAPPQSFTAVVGDVGDDTLASLPQVVDGVATAGEGEDLSIDPEAQTIARPLGQPLRMAQQESVLVASPNTHHVQGWLTGEAQTLADDDAYAAVAAALDEAYVVGAFLGPGAPFNPAAVLGPGGTDEAVAELTELRDQLVSTPFDVVGLGFGVEDGEAVVTVAYHFGTDAAAQQAVPVLESLFAEGRSIQSGSPISAYVEIRDAAADGTVAVVTLDLASGRSPQTVQSMYAAQDLPFMHQ